MRLIFIRHAEPDYIHDSLTEAGFREAELLAKRVAEWPVTAFYVSPLGRAQATAAPTLRRMGRTAETLPWLREFQCGSFLFPCRSMKAGGREYNTVPWDFPVEYWTAQPEMGIRDEWVNAPAMQLSPESVKERWAETVNGVDSLLAQYGYHRTKCYYTMDKDAQRDATLVFFCHLGAADAACGHLLNIAPPLLWQSFCMLPSGITVLNTEQSEGCDIASFRCQVMGDTSHLRGTGEPVSGMAAFGDIFQG